VEHPGASEEGVVVEEVGIGQCDMVITVCGVWLLSYFFFQMTKWNLLTAVANVFFIRDGF